MDTATCKFHRACATRRLLGSLAVLLPLLAWAASTSQQETAQVRRMVPDVERGRELFGICAKCHGPDGEGTVDGRVPRIAGQHASVLQKQIIDYRHDRRWDPLMEHIADDHNLGDAQAIADVTAYVSDLDRKVANGSGPGDSQSLQIAARQYSQLCSSCHAEEGAGDSKRAIPRISGQNYEYLRRQIYDAVDGRRPNFSREHVRLLARLNHEQIMGMSDYLARIGEDPAPAGHP